MADGRDVGVWDVHAQECQDANRGLFTFNPAEDNVGGWLRKKALSVLPEDAVTIDVGCGPGYWRDLFGGFEYTGFDQSAEMLRVAAGIGPTKVTNTWVQGNARALSGSFTEGQFDAAFTASVLQHNRNEPDKREIMEGVAHILRPHGYFLCAENTFKEDNCPASVGNPYYSDNYSFTPGGWEKFMASCGFKLLDYNDNSEYFYQRVS